MFKFFYFIFFQVVKGIRYNITAELSNTQWKKSTMLRKIDFYPESHKVKVTLNMCVNYCSCERMDSEIHMWIFF